MGNLPIFSVNCAFREDNLWRADTNIPISQPLIDILSKIPGIEKIYAYKTYSFFISVATLFNEMEVKQNVNVTYKTFFKALKVEISPEEKSVLDGRKLVMPNGQVFIPSSSDELELIHRICSDFSDSEFK